MFVDLVGSTALSSRLDPEEMREILHAYQDAVTGEVCRMGVILPSSWATEFWPILAGPARRRTIPSAQSRPV